MSNLDRSEEYDEYILEIFRDTVEVACHCEGFIYINLKNGSEVTFWALELLASMIGTSDIHLQRVGDLIPELNELWFELWDDQTWSGEEQACLVCKYHEDSVAKRMPPPIPSDENVVTV